MYTGRILAVNTIQYTDDASLDCILETYIILSKKDGQVRLTNVTPIN